MKRIFTAMAATALLGALTTANVAARQTINLTMASSHPTTFLPVGVMSTAFKNRIDEQLKAGRLLKDKLVHMECLLNPVVDLSWRICGASAEVSVV